MPSIVISPIKITHVSGNGTVTFGDVFQIAPKSVSKSYSGAGGGNNGDFMQTNTLFSITSTVDPDVADNAIAGNLS